MSIILELYWSFIHGFFFWLIIYTFIYGFSSPIIQASLCLFVQIFLCPCYLQHCIHDPCILECVCIQSTGTTVTCNHAHTYMNPCILVPVYQHTHQRWINKYMTSRISDYARDTFWYRTYVLTNDHVTISTKIKIKGGKCSQKVIFELILKTNN
jgi:hypothetical protein